MEQQARDRILKASRQEFSEKGYDGARMAEIARKAKVNQAMLHYYFNTKENLYEQVLEQLFGLAQKGLIIKYFNKHSLNPSQDLYLSIYFLVHLYLNPRNPVIERFLYSQIGSGGIKQLIKIVKKFFLPQFQFLVKTLQSGIEYGDFESGDATFSAMEIVLFIAAYEHFRLYFADTEMYGHIYGKDYKKRVFDFLIKRSFKDLCPAGKKLVIPAVSDSLINEADVIINSILHEIHGGVND